MKKEKDTRIFRQAVPMEKRHQTKVLTKAKRMPNIARFAAEPYTVTEAMKDAAKSRRKYVANRGGKHASA